MEQQGQVWIANVRVISDGLALVCEIGGRRVAVPHFEVSRESAVRRPGDFGVLVVSRGVADRLKIAPPRRN